MAAQATLPNQDMEFVQFHLSGIYGAGVLITKGARGEGGCLLNNNGERFIEKYAPTTKDLASRDAVSRSINMEIREGRGARSNKDYIHLQLSQLPPNLLMERLPSIAETASIFLGVDIRKDPIPVLPTVHYYMGGIPTNWKVSGLYTAGEAACVSVLGANRLGGNSWLDIVVFGQAAALDIAANNEKDIPYIAALDDVGYNSINDIERIGLSDGDMKTAELRLQIHKAMQNDVTVFQTEEPLSAGLKAVQEVEANFTSRLCVLDRSPI